MHKLQNMSKEDRERQLKWEMDGTDTTGIFRPGQRGWEAKREKEWREAQAKMKEEGGGQ
jgi:hypothetical protein